MRKTRPILWFFCLIGLVLLWKNPASATTIDPLIFEEMILRADFVGIVECEQAGGIVAKYKVIESWKGPKADQKFSIRIAVNYWQPQFPIALRGDRFLVMAYESAPWRVSSTTSGAEVPLWWREIPAEYELPLFQGRTFLSPEHEKSLEFQKTRKAAQDLLALKPNEQEGALLKALIEHVFWSKAWRGGESDPQKGKELRARFAKMTTAEAQIDEMLRLTKEDPEKWIIRTRIVLEKGGGPITSDRLTKLLAEKLPWTTKEFSELAQRLNWRPDAKSKDRPTKTNELPFASLLPKLKLTEARLLKLRKALADGMEADDFEKAFLTLTIDDPGSVAQFLTDWKNPAKDWRDVNRGYELGSYFAWKCSQDRQKHLKALLLAKDPFVRVAGAVYLCFEDLEQGMGELKKLTALNGEPGTWAALTLARRGQKAAVPRALEAFREGENDPAGMAGAVRDNFREQILVLFSNSARAADVPQPVIPERSGQRFDYLLRWWQQNNDKVVLGDPWLKILEKQKVD